MGNGITRLAPSPTGALHLGNARTFLINYLLAVRCDWRVLLRVEDLDGPRIKQGAVTQAMEDLRWLGLRWEEPIVMQSRRQAVYQEALLQLIAAGVAYPCTCSRKDIAQAGLAPHAEDATGSYPGTCRGRWRSADHAAESTGRPVAWRVSVPSETICVDDGFAGRHAFDLTRTCGDFVIFRNEGRAAYQLAVVCDDTEFGVDQIVRGDDLLESAACQIILRRLLGLRPEPNTYHLPLVVGPDGRRLAKRHGDTRLAVYRHRGVPPQRLLGLLGYWSGLLARRRPATLQELMERFDLSRLPHRPVVLTQDDETFLCNGT